MKNQTRQYLAEIEDEVAREVAEGQRELSEQEAEGLCYVPNAVLLIYEQEIQVYPRFFSHAPRSVCESLGATEFKEDEENSGYNPVILKAKWPECIWILGKAIEAKWPAGQWIYQPRDVIALHKAVTFWMAGEIVEAWGLVAGHDGVPAAEMPRSLLEQADCAGLFETPAFCFLF